MIRLGFFLVTAALVLFTACGGAEGETKDVSFSSLDGQSITASAIGAPSAPAFSPPPAGAPREERAAVTADSFVAQEQNAAGTLEMAQRRVISTGAVSLEVEEVDAAVAQVRVISESWGGFVEQLSSSGGAGHQWANMTIRVPQEQFFFAMEKLEGLGEVQSRNVGSQDVSEQFIDLEARLKSALRQEESLLSLLSKAQNVSEVLSIERELSRVRSEIERFQGQLNFLERRVELATINVSLSSPQQSGEPPFVSVSIEVSDVTGSVDEVKALVGSRDGAVDQVLLSVRDGQERAEVSLRVFTVGFSQTLSSIEGQGKLLSKELREGTTPADAGERPKEPDARISISYIEKTRTGIGPIVTIVACVALLGALFLGAYRLGRRRARQSQP